MSIEACSLGWYGKLPCLGDFISKRLPDDFINKWDAWLQTGMLEGKALFGESWNEQFLTFPVWRFVVNRHVIDDNSWIGLLFPSADRVGRLFPFTVTFPVPADSPTLFSLTEIDQILDEIETLVHQVLDDDGLDDFERGLAQLAVDPPLLAAHPGQGLFELENSSTVMPLEYQKGINGLLGALAVRELFTRGISGGLWWVPAVSGENGIVRTSPAGLAPAHFIDLVRGIT